MWKVAAFIALALLPAAASAGCIWSRLDHLPSYSRSGAWSSNVYRGIADTAAALDVAGAVWDGADSRIGRTLWQSVDAMALSTAALQVGKFFFTRARPTEGNDPCRWFQGGAHYSFPSGEAAFSAALVMPFVLEYGREQPVTYALLLLPAYVGVGRLKNHAHWPTDILAGWAVGAGVAWWDHNRETPFFVSILPRGFMVGLRREF
jgi:undecaprenyl-diphosphatase